MLVVLLCRLCQNIMCDGGSCQEYRGIMVNGRPDNMAQVAVLDGNLQNYFFTSETENANIPSNLNPKTNSTLTPSSFVTRYIRSEL